MREHPGSGAPARFVGAGEAIEAAGRVLRSPLVYVAAHEASADASTIVTTLRVGKPEHATRLGYWPSYADATPDQRAVYLDWVAGGRTDPDVPIGYPFIFFFGLERRTLVDRADEAACVAEVLRMLEHYGSNRSFRSQAERWLTFLDLLKLGTLSEAALRRGLGQRAAREASARAGVLAWYHDHEKPLPAEHAMHVVAQMEGAASGTVVRRCGEELARLYALRYREAFGEGLRLTASLRRCVVEYRPASATLVRGGVVPEVSLTNVLGEPGQFATALALWNRCVGDLRQVNRKKLRALDGEMTVELWEALPPALREQTEHPHASRWDELLARAPRTRGVALVRAGELASLGGVAFREKLTAKRAAALCDQAAILGYAVEPDARVCGRGWAWEAPVAIWKTHDATVPDPQIYVSASNFLTLLLAVATADDDIDERELESMTRLMENTFALDDSTRLRLQALREVLLCSPSRASAIARKLRDARPRSDVLLVGKMLVQIAGADGVLTVAEQENLTVMFRNLGLTQRDLDVALLHSNLRLAVEEVETLGGTAPSRGDEVIPPPPPYGTNGAREVVLDFERIAQLHHETRELADVLAELLEDDSNRASTARAQGSRHVGANALGPTAY